MSDVKYRVRPESVPVDQQTEVQLTMIMDRSLRTGETIAFALPVAWNCQRYCVTYTKEPQSTRRDAPGFVAVESSDALFEVSIEPIMLPSGSAKGHVRKIAAKIIITYTSELVRVKCGIYLTNPGGTLTASFRSSILGDEETSDR